MINVHLKNWKLKNKIILHVAVVGSLAALFITFLYLNAQKSVIHKMSQQKAEIVSAMIERSIYSAMKDGKLEEVQSALTDIASTEDIIKIRILDPHGDILRSSKEEEQGHPASPATQDNLSSFLSGSTRSGTYFITKQTQIQEFRSIENRTECFGCHDPGAKFNGILAVDIDYTSTAALLRKSQLQGILIGLIALGTLAFIIIRLFDKLINRPISRLKEKMREVQEGNLDVEFSAPKSDEIGSLTKSFDEMAKKLYAANKKVEDLFNKQITKAGHLASLGELAAGLAHEIKNPIAGMKGALEIINQRTDEADPKKEIFTEMLLQVEKINHVVEDLLSYAKPKEMKISLIDPNDCVQNAIKLAKPHINNKDIQFHFRPLENERLAYIDSNKIQEVLLNLLLNSISSIDKKGEISIELQEKNEKELEIVFSDSGRGIKQEHLPHIFHPFFTTKKRGTGLGLSICKNIIDAHRGSIGIDSTANVGTTFLIRMPVLYSGS